jgi:hypothetical protein
MYEHILTEASRSTDAALNEAKERSELAASRSQQADRQAKESTKAVGERWVNRINAMRRRAADAAEAAHKKRNTLQFGPEDGHTEEPPGEDELVSLVDPPAPGTTERTPAFGTPAQPEPQPAQPAGYGRHSAEREPNRYVSSFGEFEDDQPVTPPPPVRRSSAPARRPRHEEVDDDDYSGQSWLQGR